MKIYAAEEEYRHEEGFYTLFHLSLDMTSVIISIINLLMLLQKQGDVTGIKSACFC